MDDHNQMHPEFLKILKYYDFFNEHKRLDLVPRKTSEKSIEFRKEGNELYRKKNHNETRKILSFYNQSMAHAPNGSEELALAFSNRSALWLRLHKYDLSLTDIERALNITISSDLRDKLLARQMECLKLNQSTPQSNCQRSELPEFVQSGSISCAADCIKLECNEKFGSHYTATRYIKPGEVIISEQSPYVFVKFNQLYLVCSYCLGFAWAGIPCDSCVFAIYCSENCKKEAWSQFHDVQCAITSLLMCKGLENMNLFNCTNLAKAIIISVRKEGIGSILSEVKKIENLKALGIEELLIDGKLNCKKFKSVYSLTRAKDSDQDENKEFQTSLVLSLLYKFLMDECNTNQCQVGCGTLVVLMKSILKRLDSIFDCNSYAFQPSICTCADIYHCTPDCVSKRGSILAPCSSLINHSCDQNVSRMCIPGSRIALFTLRPIRKGEQVCTSYGPDPKMMPKEDRRAILQQTHGFLCECKACDENWPTPPEAPTQYEIREVFSQFPETLTRAYEEILAIVEKPMTEWQCSKELLQDAAKLVDIIYQNFDNQRAYLVADPFKYFIDGSFFRIYGEDVCFSSDWS